MAFTLPLQHRALVLKTIEEGLHLKHLQTPQPEPGNAIVRIEVASVLSYHREVYDGTRQYSFPMPLVGGVSAIGRIVALGPDATILQKGQLVFCDCVIHARDDPDTTFLSAIHDGSSEGSKKLMRTVWRDGTFAEYAKVPLENCIPLNEAKLCDSLGYSISDLMYIANLLVPYGGLRDIHLEPGETIVVSPATGGYGGAGVQVAVAMGARVIAMGRNEQKLARLKEHVLSGTPSACIEIVKMSGNEAADMAALQVFGTIDAILDFTPPHASNSTHLKSAVSALRRNGRVSMMGFVDRPMVPWTFVGNNISMKGKLMYERDDIVQFVKMLERGLFPRGEEFVDTQSFALEGWKVAFEAAAEHAGIGKQVVLIP
ncbi:GroES-like protein [Lentithecium fluviatile CBS 122367]|uniref:GroES-like protein n=1 Tax=Lentithecium fluviatile CBS 122367 TaxID=1168545 RepID=A0A6G1J141_9PLEO|nr:GroES-like protein [Lentithecium fluviatile CBS 122367]